MHKSQSYLILSFNLALDNTAKIKISISIQYITHLSIHVDDRINVTNRVKFCKATFASALNMYRTRCHVINTI